MIPWWLPLCKALVMFAISCVGGKGGEASYFDQLLRLVVSVSHTSQRSYEIVVFSLLGPDATREELSILRLAVMLSISSQMTPQP